LHPNIGPYRITKVLRNDVVEKVGEHEGPYETSTEYIKRWVEYVNELLTDKENTEISEDRY